MTNSYFPRSPLPGSNAIGEFEIGVSPIGTITEFAWQNTIISQYANSDRLMTLIANFSSYIDPTQNLDRFFDLVWNVDTAEGWGLDVWGRIVGVNRVLEVPSPDYFGFDEALPGVLPFNQGVFYSGQALTSNYRLTDQAYRTLILAKAMSNICDGSIPAINQILLSLFPDRGNCYVADDGAMELTYTFEFELSPLEQAIVFQSGVLPTPCGVTANVVTA